VIVWGFSLFVPLAVLLLLAVFVSKLDDWLFND
jgi:hypothetical protein